MYEAYVNNKFTNVLVMYVMYLGFCFIAPIFFIWKLMHTILRCCRPMENMSGKVVLITGASSGIGEGMAYEYAKKGAYLVVAARREEMERLQQVAQKSRTLGSRGVLVVPGDVSNRDDCKILVDQTIAHFGQLDHLVNNAGIGNIYSLNMDLTKFEHVMDINFWGSVHPTHFAIPHLKKTDGKIVVNTSAAAILHPPKSALYAASKAALIGFFESLRHELPPTMKITIATLGFIETNIFKGLNEEKAGNFHKNIHGVFPMMSVEPCARSIVEAACRGDSHVTEPKFYKVFYLYKSLCPEFVEWCASKIIKTEGT